MPSVPRSRFPRIPILMTLIAGPVFATAAQGASLNVSPGSGTGGAPVALSASRFNEDYNTGFYLMGPSTQQLIGTCPPDNRVCTDGVAGRQPARVDCPAAQTATPACSEVSASAVRRGSCPLAPGIPAPA